MSTIRKSTRLKEGDLRAQNAILAREIKRLAAVAEELVAKNKTLKDEKVKEYVQRVLRLGKIDIAIRYSSKLMFSLTTAKEKARLEKELEF